MSDKRPLTYSEKWQLWLRRQREESPAFSENVTEVLSRVSPCDIFTQGAPSMYKAGTAFMAGLSYIIIVVALNQTGLVVGELLMQFNFALPFVVGLVCLIAGYVVIYMQFSLKDKVWRQVDPAIVRDPNTNEAYPTVLRIMSRPQRVWTPRPEQVANRMRLQREALTTAVSDEPLQEEGELT